MAHLSLAELEARVQQLELAQQQLPSRANVARRLGVFIDQLSDSKQDNRFDIEDIDRIRESLRAAKITIQNQKELFEFHTGGGAPGYEHHAIISEGGGGRVDFVEFDAHTGNPNAHHVGQSVAGNYTTNQEFIAHSGSIGALGHPTMPYYGARFLNSWGLGVSFTQLPADLNIVVSFDADLKSEGRLRVNVSGIYMVEVVHGVRINMNGDNRSGNAESSISILPEGGTKFFATGADSFAYFTASNNEATTTSRTMVRLNSGDLIGNEVKALVPLTYTLHGPLSHFNVWRIDD